MSGCLWCTTELSIALLSPSLLPEFRLKTGGRRGVSTDHISLLGCSESYCLGIAAVVSPPHPSSCQSPALLSFLLCLRHCVTE